MNLAGKIALVTGGTRGIGAAVAAQLAAAGAEVALAARQLDSDGEKLLAEIVRQGRRAIFVRMDCGQPAEIERGVKAAAEQLGAIDVLVHAAGGPVNGGLFDLTAEAWAQAFAVHVHAVFHLSRAVLPAMREKKEGAIILISSTAGLRGIVTNIAYQTAKGALPQMTRALAREFANDNVRINCVAPGVIRTAFHAQMTPEQRRLNLEQRIPLHREGTPEQVADAILMLIRNDYITGETIVIDGGLTMRIA